MASKHPYRSLALPLLVGFACVLRSPLVYGVDESAAAQALFDEAKKLSSAGDFATACPKFAASQKLDPSGGTLLHLATCHEREGKTATAWSEFNESISWARRDNRADREAYATSHLNALEGRLVKLNVVVSAAVQASGAHVTRDGRPLAEAEWGTFVPVDPGDHLVEATAPGRVKWSKSVHLDAKSGNVTVIVPELDKEPTRAGDGAAQVNTRAVFTPTAGEQTSTTPSSSGSTQRTIGVVLGSVGIAALGVGSYFEAKALSKAEDRDDAARSGDASATEQLHHEAKTAQTTAFITGGLGLAALGTGVTLYFVAPKQSATVRVAPRIAADAYGLVLEGAY